jgi:sugar lactone lactonase YvrE
LQAHAFDAKGNRLPEAPANFRRLGEARMGEAADVHTLTFRFAETAKLTEIKSTNDFRIEPGGSCFKGNTYTAGSTCSLLVRFTPQGAGNRLGHVTVSTNLSASPMAFGLGGYGYAPIVSFIPSIINTLPGSLVSGVGLLSGAQNLAIDGGDTLWVSDTGNNVVRDYDSGGAFKTLASGYTAPRGIAVDTFGEAYFDLPAANNMYEIYDYGPVVQVNGAGSNTCTAATPCNLSAQALGTPGTMSMDGYNHLFFVDGHMGSAFATVQPLPAKLVFLYNPFPYQTSPSSPMAVDTSENLYSFWTNAGTCSIIQASLYNAENSNVSFNKIAGGHTCGFTGDGGLAGNAEIGSLVGQFAFDTAGNMYFTDTNNQRVRRIDYTTGVIRTIAGNGTKGYTNDGASATGAELSNPTGVAVDSQGQVYIISSATTGQVIRKVTATGFRNLGSVPKGTKGVAQTVLVSNVGNSALTITNTLFTGPAPADFSIDPATTSCALSPGSVLGSGQTCQIGFILTPSVAAARSASFVIQGNTINNSSVIVLLGTGTLPNATFTITSPTSGASFTSGTAVTFKVSVTSGSAPAPTGTVQFKVDGANYGSPVTIASGAASTSVTGLTIAPHTLSATYSGDANYAAGGPISVPITVHAVKIMAAVTLSPTAAVSSCSPVQFGVAVKSTSSTVATGEVTLLDGSNTIASGALSNGMATLSAARLGPGSHTLTAHYAGDSHFLPANSPALIEAGSAAGSCQPAAPITGGSQSGPPML